MKNIIPILFLTIPLTALAQKDVIQSIVYPWKQPAGKSKSQLNTAVLFEGIAHDMEWMQMNSIRLQSSSSGLNLKVPMDEEHLLLVKQGTLKLQVGEAIHRIGGGSIALLLPGESYRLQNEMQSPMECYLLKYRSKSPVDHQRAKNAGGSLVMDWKQINFKEHDKGGIRNYFERATAMCKRLEMHVTTLKGGLKSHDPHTHRAEELVVMMNGNTEMQIGQQFYKGSDGSTYFLGSNILHAIRNEDKEPCMYFAIQFE